jgi:hypothetical protein
MRVTLFANAVLRRVGLLAMWRADDSPAFAEAHRRISDPSSSVIEVRDARELLVLLEGRLALSMKRHYELCDAFRIALSALLAIGNESFARMCVGLFCAMIQPCLRMRLPADHYGADLHAEVGSMENYRGLIPTWEEGSTAVPWNTSWWSQVKIICNTRALSM